jgi:hypothetical protein
VTMNLSDHYRECYAYERQGEWLGRFQGFVVGMLGAYFLMMVCAANGQDGLPPLPGYVPPTSAPVVKVEPSKPVPEPTTPTAPTTTKPVVPATKPFVVRRFLLFTSRNCRHCPQTKRAATEWKKFAKPRPGEYVEYELVDADLYPGRVQQFGVDAYPTLVVTLNGREIARHIGAISTAAGIERFVSQAREPTRRVSVKNVLKPEFRDTERMRRHLVEDHGYTAEEVRGKSREWLFEKHDAAHGEVLR